jgi:DNA polymerase elongation subunit (family B)
MIYKPLVFDIETSVAPEAKDFLSETVQVPASYKKQETIDKYIAEHLEKQARNAALDIDLGRIVTICWTADNRTLRGGHAENEEQEAALLSRFWDETQGSTYVGFNILDFDLPMCLRRSQYLGISYPEVQIDRFRHPQVCDLMQILTWNGKVHARKLDFYVRRFKLNVPQDEVTGADVPTLVLAKDWAKVKKHCACDVKKEWALGVKLWLIDESISTTVKDNPF